MEPMSSVTGIPRRLGLLVCDSLWEPLRSAHDDYPQMCQNMLGAVDARFSLSVWAAHEGELPPDPACCDAWLISGSRAGVYESRAWIAPLMNFVRRAFDLSIPQAGICFGHQLLAQALGGETRKAVSGWGVGNLEVRISPEAGYGTWLGERLRLFMVHQDQVLALPPRAEVVGSAAHCAHALFRIDQRVLGIQPHPEFTRELMQDLLQENALHLPEPLLSQARASCASPVDSPRVAGLMADFLGLR